MEFLEGLDPQLKLFWYIAIPISLIFVLQTILTFVGSEVQTVLKLILMGIWMVQKLHSSFSPCAT